jgi:hypothetical protein
MVLEYGFNGFRVEPYYDDVDYSLYQEKGFFELAVLAERQSV